MKIRKIFISLVIFILIAAVCSTNVLGAGFDPGMEFESKAMLLINLDTDTVVYEKNADERREPASTTKIMTYIIACEEIDDLNTVITVPQEVEDTLLGTDSSMSGVMVGEELTALQLLNMMMVPSGNDAALTLALYVGGGDESVFAEKMNAKAKMLGCKDTHFTNSHGLHDENHYTTARDLSIIAKYAMTLPYFMEITNQLYYTLPPTNVCDEERDVFATNRMLNQNVDDGKYYYKYVQGIKTGSHDHAGYCLVSTAVSDGYSYLCVALGAPYVDENGDEIETHNEMLDTRDIYQWAFENLSIRTIIKEGDVKGEVAVNYAWSVDSTLAAANQSLSALLPNEVELSSIVYKADLPESIDAPVKKGDKLGTVTMIYADQELGTVDLIALENIDESKVLKTVDIGREILLSNWVVSIVCIVVFLVLIYVILALIYARKRKKEKSREKSAISGYKNNHDDRYRK